MRQHPSTAWLCHLGGHLSFLDPLPKKTAPIFQNPQYSDSDVHSLEYTQKWSIASALAREGFPKATPTDVGYR